MSNAFLPRLMRSTARNKGALCLAAAGLLAGCAGPRYTVDDGRAVNPELLKQIENYGLGERSIRPAIAQSAALKDRECDKQWELPFSVSTSQGWEETDRVAWVRALKVDERLTVVGVVEGSPLKPGDKIVDIDGEDSEETVEMLEELATLRDKGRPFPVKTAAGKKVTIKPFEVCRGYVRLAPPNTPTLQDYHWLMSYHPLEIAQNGLTQDEALWAVLWTQGVSEEGGARMKTYHYGSKVLGSLYTVATLATGLKGAAMAADAAIKAAQQAAATAATDMLKQQIVDQAKEYALSRLKDEATKSVQALTQAQVMSSMEQVAKNRGLLGGVSRVAATVFDEADAWAYQKMKALGADALAGFSLHQKLLENGLLTNALVLDPDRMNALQALAAQDGRAEEVVTRLKGIRPESLDFQIAEMPLESSTQGFSYEDTADTEASTYAHGLVEAMLGMNDDKVKGK
jgi:hypothetical protein